MVQSRPLSVSDVEVDTHHSVVTWKKKQILKSVSPFTQATSQLKQRCVSNEIGEK